MAVASHYRKKLEKEELKRLSKEVAKKLVRGDYKSGRVKDPTAKLSSKHEKTVKHYVKEFLDKAVRKKEEREKHKAYTGVTSGSKGDTPATPQGEMKAETPQWDEEMLNGKDTVLASQEASPSAASELKRKREEAESFGSPKKSRRGSDDLQSIPPPPPPPPAEDMPVDSEEYDITPMDDASTMSFPPTDEVSTSATKPALRANGHPDIKQSATPLINGSRNGKWVGE